MAEKKPVQERIILGIDPGTSVMGYGIIMAKGKKMELMRMGVIRLSKYPDHAVKMKKIFDRVCQLIEEFSPDELAIEAPFFGKNVQSMLKLGRAQGVSIAAALRYDMSYVEYAPRKIKQSITGNGNASKEQVAAMLQSTLNIPAENMPKDLDATDGLGAAVCHFYQSSNTAGGKSYASWKSFINENPTRAKKK
ncbi:MAG: crossover junction endodeoxyribonuclease RuvC [Flavobacteriales bacterium]|jgi:crossover junction endodeoxyribonuclease RuvC